VPYLERYELRRVFAHYSIRIEPPLDRVSRHHHQHQVLLAKVENVVDSQVDQTQCERQDEYELRQKETNVHDQM